MAHIASDRIDISIHTKIVNKNETNENRGLGWSARRLSIIEIAKHLKTGGAICVALLKGGHREDENFVSSRVIGLDFDEGPNVEHFVEKDDFCSKYASIFMSTASSTLEAPRTRVFFLLDQVISDGEEYKRLVTNLMARLSYPGIDAVCKSCTQIFYGNNNAYSFVLHESAFLPIEVLRSLPEAQKVLQAIKSTGSDIEVDLGSLTISKETLAELLAKKVDEGERDATSLRIAGMLCNIMSPDAVEVILRGWYDTNVLDKTDFEFEKIQDQIKRMSGKSSALVGKVSKVVADHIQGKTATPQPASKAVLSSMTTKFADFMDQQEEDTKWLIKDWLPEATTAMMVAPPGHFKTWIALHMALSISTGRPFFNTYEVQDKLQPVLFMQQEDAKHIIRKRSSVIAYELGKYDAPAYFGPDGEVEIECRVPNLHFWTAADTFRLDNDQAIQNLKSIILDLGLKAIFIDPLYAITDSSDYMSKDAQRMVEFKRMRDMTGCSFIILHHTKKSALPAQGPGSAKTSRLDSWGSQFLNAWLETGFQIRSTPVENTISILRHFKSIGERYTDTFTLDINSDETKGDKHFTVTSEKVQEKEGNKLDVIAIFDKYGPMSVSDYAKRSGIAISTASRRLNKLVDKGVLLKNDQNAYSLLTIDFSD